MQYIDIHTHTRYSDATVSVEHSLRSADELCLSVFSVTDHNTVDAYDEIYACRDLFRGSILPGVELNSLFHGEIVEVLGYGIDIPKMKERIKQNYLPFYEKQVLEAKLNIQSMLQYGVKLGDEFVNTMLHSPERIFDPSHTSSRKYILEEIKRYPENARFFSGAEELETIDRGRFTREYVFNPRSTLYCDQTALYPSVKQAIELVHQCGGFAFLAHPYVYSSHVSDSLDELARSGFDGIECYYGTFTAEQKQYLCDFCDSNGLYKSGGSDYHGTDMRPLNLMGLSSGEKIPYSLVSPWLDKISDSLF